MLELPSTVDHCVPQHHGCSLAALAEGLFCNDQLSQPVYCMLITTLVVLHERLKPFQGTRLSVLV